MSFPSPFAQPRGGSPALIPPAPAGPPPIPVKPRRSRVGLVWVAGILIVLAIVLVAYFLTFVGPGASAVGLVLALIPLTGVLIAVRVVDRWEPEPRGPVLFALAWGAIVSIALALLVGLGLSVWFGADDSTAGEVVSTVIRAPIVEELAKGLGVLLIFAYARRSFDGPVDGVVYGALVGAGFAFTENIQYFGLALIEGGAVDTTTTFFLRGIMSPFAHVMFTSATGFALGLAARRGARGGAAAGAWLLGVLVAIGLHALWNGSAVLGDFFLLYITLQVPLFIGFILGIIALRREEARLTRRRLGEYAQAGWFTVQEVDMLATGRGRKAAIAWAQGLRGDRTALMKRFIADATELAATRQRAVTGRDPDAALQERGLLERTAAARAALFAP